MNSNVNNHAEALKILAEQSVGTLFMFVDSPNIWVKHDAETWMCTNGERRWETLAESNMAMSLFRYPKDCVLI